MRYLVVCEGYFPYGFRLGHIPAVSMETDDLEEAKKFVKEDIKTSASIYAYGEERLIDHGCSRLPDYALEKLAREAHEKEYGL